MSLAGHLRITNKTGRPTDEEQRLMAAFLEGSHQHQLDKMASMEAFGGRIKAHIEGDGSLGEVSLQRLTVGGVSDEAPPLQVVQQIRHVIFLSSTTSCEAD
ncbi:hypothetical protein HMPREF9569_01384 [Cutibacterium acnes HL078PA1]|nr:hypothetical protein HMPREF9569_01384 [Cutibacterium acnes HL078PA1]